MSTGRVHANADVFPELDGRFVSLTTFRRSGEGVATPLWFARGHGCLYMVTHATSGKVRRLALNPDVEVARCTSAGRVTGPSYAGRALIISGDESRTAARAISRRYFRVPRSVIEWEMRRRGRGQPAVYIRVSPR